MEVSDWKAAIERERRRKDLFFKLHPESPIPPEDRARFTGLDYYPPDPKYKFVAELHEYRDKEKLRMVYTRGGEREFIRWGEFRLKIDGKDVILHAYKSDPKEDRLFIPFRDLTSGKETYGAGRYIDLDGEVDRTPDGKWILDFNKAYNPWCAYNEAYTCPLVPIENWLRVPIYAGEKKYPLKRERKEEG
ncbi:hypothetical protein DRO55_04210 [Candidatus Bathyarchaeota archaeon]|nr:MAG: hypothetical protein DRO55_04210 [Candidatus Bathyarchaeota archaeon]